MLIVKEDQRFVILSTHSCVEFAHSAGIYERSMWLELLDPLAQDGAIPPFFIFKLPNWELLEFLAQNDELSVSWGREIGDDHGVSLNFSLFNHMWIVVHIAINEDLEVNSATFGWNRIEGASAVFI